MVKIISVIILLILIVGIATGQVKMGETPIVSEEKVKISTDSTVTIVSRDEIERLETESSIWQTRMENRLTLLETKVQRLESKVNQ